eukprot:2458350-Rhodomonas_salina.1
MELRCVELQRFGIAGTKASRRDGVNIVHHARHVNLGSWKVGVDVVCFDHNRCPGLSFVRVHDLEGEDVLGIALEVRVDLEDQRLGVVVPVGFACNISRGGEKQVVLLTSTCVHEVDVSGCRVRTHKRRDGDGGALEKRGCRRDGDSECVFVAGPRKQKFESHLWPIRFKQNFGVWTTIGCASPSSKSQRQQGRSMSCVISADPLGIPHRPAKSAPALSVGGSKESMEMSDPVCPVGKLVAVPVIGFSVRDWSVSDHIPNPATPVGLARKSWAAFCSAGQAIGATREICPVVRMPSANELMVIIGWQCSFSKSGTLVFRVTVMVLTH